MLHHPSLGTIILVRENAYLEQILATAKFENAQILGLYWLRLYKTDDSTSGGDIKLDFVELEARQFTIFYIRIMPEQLVVT